MLAAIALRLGSSGSCSAASSIHEKVASTTTGRPRAHFHKRKPPISASRSAAAAVAAAAQSATQSAAPLESDAAQYPVSAAVAAAAAAALAAGRDVLAAAAAVDRWTLTLAACAFTGSSAVLAMLSSAAPAADPVALMIGCGATAAAMCLLCVRSALARNSPRLAALQSAGQALWTWQLAWHLTSAFLPVSCCSPVCWGVHVCVCVLNVCACNSAQQQQRTFSGCLVALRGSLHSHFLLRWFAVLLDPCGIC